MVDRGLTFEELNKIYGKSSVPFLLTFFACLAYTVYMMHISAINSDQDMVKLLLLPLLISESLAFFVSFEFFCHRKMKKPFGYHVKRLSMNMLLALTTLLPFVAVIPISATYIAPSLGKRMSFALTLLLYAVALGSIAFKCKKFLAKHFG
jgi:hypothetical protein